MLLCGTCVKVYQQQQLLILSEYNTSGSGRSMQETATRGVTCRIEMPLIRERIDSGGGSMSNRCSGG